MNSCRGRNWFFVVFAFVFFVLLFLSKLQSIFFNQKRKHYTSVKTGFLTGVLSGKAASNKFVHCAQGFHSKTRSFSPFFFSLWFRAFFLL